MKFWNNTRPSIFNNKFLKLIANIAIALSIAYFTYQSTALAAEPSTAAWQSLLKNHVELSGGVDYVGFKENEAKLDSFLASYAAIDPSKMSQDKRKAIYINLYNAFMVKNILTYAASEKIKIDSAKFLELKINKIDVPGGNIWNGNYKVKMAGQELNLDNIEHQLIRGVDADKLEKFSVKVLDPRIHTAVNCAALSCPRVRETAYTEANVNQLLNENIKEYISSETHFSLISDSKLKANSIVFWYYSDFDTYAQKTLKLNGAGDYLASFLDPKSKDAAKKKKILTSDFNDRSQFTLKISSAFSFDYDWRVNDSRNQKKVIN